MFMIVTTALTACVCLISNPILAQFSLYYAFCLIPDDDFNHHSGKPYRRQSMNNIMKTTVLATALMTSASIFANTTSTTGTSVNGQVSTSAEVQTNNKGVISSLNQGVHNAADKVGHGIEKGVDNTKEFTQDKWQDTKKFTADKKQVAQDKTKSVKEKASEKSNQAKKATQERWNKTKAALTPESKQADANTNSSVELNTPIGGAKANVHTDGSLKTQ